MLSVSRSRSKEPRFHTRFAPVAPRSIEELATLITTEIWSPIQFTGNERKRDNFQRSRIVALDFDDGETTVAEAKEFCLDLKLSHVIGTTKSHQKKKVSPSGRALPAVDRFRMLFIADSWCADRELYEWNMQDAVEAWGADPSCKDAARFFWPCAEVVSFGTGEKWQWLPLPSDHVPEKERIRRQREKLAAFRDAGGILPRWIRNFLDGTETVEAGERHKTCYKLGAQMTLCGWDEDRIFQSLMKTPLSEIGASDVRRAIANGARRAGSEG